MSLSKAIPLVCRKNVGFARALVHDPQLLILDEPVSGLDPFSISQVRELLLDVKASGCALLISSHILSEIEKIVDRVGIIYKGNLVSSRYHARSPSYGLANAIIFSFLSNQLQRPKPKHLQRFLLFKKWRRTPSN